MTTRTEPGSSPTVTPVNDGGSAPKAPAAPPGEDPGRQAGPQVRGRPGDWPRRNGHRLRGVEHGDRQARGDEVHRRSDGAERRRGCALPARGAGGERGRERAHRRDLRLRHLRGWAALHRDGAAPRRGSRPPHPALWPHRAAGGRPRHGADPPRPSPRAQGGDRPPRSQARQHLPGRPRRRPELREDPRFWHLQGAPRGRRRCTR